MAYKILYAMPWVKCNLNCPHCEIHTRDYNDNLADFMITFNQMLSKQRWDEVVFFGGEPFIYPNLAKELIKTKLFTTVSTNLIAYTSELGKAMYNSGIKSIATSWNKSRFTKLQYDLWLKNLRAATCDESLRVLVLITLTKDLIEDTSWEILNALKDMERAGGSYVEFLFEYYIGDEDLTAQSDAWLAEFHKRYKGNLNNLLEARLNHYVCDCDETYTVYPNGASSKGCPQYSSNNARVLTDCLSCDKAGACRPCPLLKGCSYPHKLAKELENVV